MLTVICLHSALAEDTAHALSNQLMQPRLDGVISACYNTQPFIKCNGVLFFGDFIALGRCEKFWFLEGTTVRYFGLELQKLFENAAGVSRSLEFGSAGSRELAYFSVYQGRVIVKLRILDSHYMQV